MNSHYYYRSYRIFFSCVISWFFVCIISRFFTAKWKVVSWIIATKRFWTHLWNICKCETDNKKHVSCIKNKFRDCQFRIICNIILISVGACHRRSFIFNLVFPFFNNFVNSFLHQFAECIILDKSNYTK